MARAMLYYMEIDRHWWGEAVMAVAHIINRIPNTAQPAKSPLEVLAGKKPVLDYLRMFGSTGFVHLNASKRTKWDAKSHRCIFLIYADNSKAYRVWDCEDNRLVRTSTVKLDEHPPTSYRNACLCKVIILTNSTMKVWMMITTKFLWIHRLLQPYHHQIWKLMN